MKFIVVNTYPEYRYLIEHCKQSGVSVGALQTLPPGCLPLAFDISGPVLGFTDSFNRAADYQQFSDFIAEQKIAAQKSVEGDLQQHTTNASRLRCAPPKF